MGFHNDLFPDDISFNSSGGPGFDTAIIKGQSGREERTARRSRPIWQYNVAYGVRSDAQMAKLGAFFIARGGAASAFPYKDWQDYTTASDNRSSASPTDQLLGVGNGVQTVFQLRKSYTSGGITFWRNLTLPVHDSVQASLDDVITTAFTVDETTGEITITPAPDEGVEVRAGCEFYVPVRFGEEADKLLSMTLEDYGVNSSENIPLVEVLGESTANEDYNFRGAFEQLISANKTIAESNGFLQAYVAAVDGLSLNLQDPTDLAPGGIKFQLINEGDTWDLSVRNEGGDLLCTLGPGHGCFVSLSVDSLGEKVWYTTT